MIEAVRIQGYKCLRSVEVEVGPFNVLIGQNDTGKSSFLQALHGQGLTTAAERVELRVGGAWTPCVVRGGATADLAAFGISAPLSIDPYRLSDPSPSDLGGIGRLVDTRGLGTAAHFAELALGDRQRFDEAEKLLREVTSGRIRNIVIRAEGASYRLAYRLEGGEVVQAREVSQGVLVFTCFLALVYREDAPKVLLVEEPENGVHPLRLKEIVDLLRSLSSRGVQIFLSTHSPDLLTWCEPEELLVFRRPPKQGTTIHKLPRRFRERVAMGDSLGQIWASRGEDGLLDLLPGPALREPAA